MSLSTYTQLQSALGSYAIRPDQAAVWPDFIAMAEARLNRLLNCRQMVNTTSAAVTGALFNLPADFNGVKALRLTGGSFTKLEPVSVDEMDLLKARADVSGEPRYYSIRGSNCEVYPEPSTSTTYQLTYFQQIPPLSGGNPTNWLLTACPDAYLYGALMHFGVMAQDERLESWTQAFETAVSEFQANDREVVAGDRMTPQPNTSIY